VANALSARLFSRRAFLAGFAAAPFAACAAPFTRDPTFTVLSLFHPQRLVLHATITPLAIVLDDESIMLRSGESLTIDVTGSRISVTNSAVRQLTIRFTSAFAVEVPHKLRRNYLGTLAIDSVGNHLRCVVGIERELAVASIVAAESPPRATPNALAAQAVAARSFMLGARTDHVGADFCDTTHCQFLREPPVPGSGFATAVRRTKGLVLRYRDAVDDAPAILAAMYSRSCGGRTRTLAELGLPSRGYPYYAVECAFCRAHPELWQRDLAAPTANSERARLDYNRIHGWSALPGHIDSTTALGVKGRGIGHGLGLCQLGAADMAAHGAAFADILSHYYPNTALVRVA
jgi:stage II sporulation protein D